MSAPMPTRILRFMHTANLQVCLRRGALHAPNHQPSDGLPTKVTHDVELQQKRSLKRVGCGPGGVIADYVPFYFGPRSPMLYQLATGRVTGYSGGQEPLVYVVAHAQDFPPGSHGFVFTDGHAYAEYTKWFDDLRDLDKVDWAMVEARIWRDTEEEPDRQRRKQAEFLAHRSVPWSLVHEIAVRSSAAKATMDRLLAAHPPEVHRPVLVRPDWYYEGCP